ncbi:hypothetical protein [uncultured Amphritea sp.]|uniref:hypothetical protein n=1 Tax=uncultured Amphritea sp. TaxID=981605 RepID=UPI0026121515|nr:hypothetical protein [uncultured Amphritea sp.]
MNTGEYITVIHKDRSRTSELLIWCDICGYGAREDHKTVYQKIHFCRRHKASEIDRFMSGELPGYFELKNTPPSN